MGGNKSEGLLQACISSIDIPVVKGKDKLCFVSPLKQSNQTSYFTARLQTLPQQVVRIVSFSPEKRSEFCKHQNVKSSVKISNFKLSSKKSSDDVAINNNTSIESIQRLTFFHIESYLVQLSPLNLHCKRFSRTTC